MARITSKELYDKLLNEEKILSIKGQIKFYLGSTDIIVKQKDVVGNIMQEWVEGWLKNNGIEFSTNTNTQMPPDLYLDPNDKTRNLLEVKAFNYKASPGFDIADFNAFQREIISQPYMLDVDYLIFGYVMTDDGYVVIKKVWLQKIYEICRSMEKWPLNLQIKRNVVHKIRPAKWYGASKYSTFKTLEHFLSAMEECVFKNPDTRLTSASDWKDNMEKSFKDFYSKEIEIPRWNDIKKDYMPEKTTGKKK